jgi:hypothetical protein
MSTWPGRFGPAHSGLPQSEELVSLGTHISTRKDPGGVRPLVASDPDKAELAGNSRHVLMHGKQSKELILFLGGVLPIRSSFR